MYSVALDSVIEWHREPKVIRFDNGAEFVSHAMHEWVREVPRVRMLCSAPRMKEKGMPRPVMISDADAGSATGVETETDGAEVDPDDDSDEAADASGDDASRGRCESRASLTASLLEET